MSDLLPLNRQQVLEEYFVENRTRLLEIAAFLDRLDRARGETDFRRRAFEEAIEMLRLPGQRVEAIAMLFSDPTAEPLGSLDRKSALGAFDARSLEARS